MKVKISDILNSSPILQELNATRLSINAAYKVHKLTQECNIVYQSFEKEKTELLGEHMTEAKKGKDRKFKSKKHEDTFMEKSTEMVGVEIEVPDISISMDDIEDFKVTPGSIAVIDWFIK